MKILIKLSSYTELVCAFCSHIGHGHIGGVL